jgi:redox-sensing transcriptional repressor
MRCWGEDKLKREKIPKATIARLPLYLRSLSELAEKGVPVVSSYELAELAGGNAAQLRKDLSYFGEFGTRGVGYDVGHLLYQISKFLGLTRERNAAIVGMGKLGPALLAYRGFGEKGFKIVAVFDNDIRKIGKMIDGLEILDIDSVEQEVKEKRIEIGIITTPASAAQLTANKLVAAGVKAILNFAPVTVVVPSDVVLRQVDLAVELQILSFHHERQTAK